MFNIDRIATNMEREYPNFTRQQAVSRATEIVDGIKARQAGITQPDRPNPYSQPIPQEKRIKQAIAEHSKDLEARRDDYADGLMEAINAGARE